MHYFNGKQQRHLPHQEFNVQLQLAFHTSHRQNLGHIHILHNNYILITVLPV